MKEDMNPLFKVEGKDCILYKGVNYCNWNNIIVILN
jgi:hypothetical protein